MLDRIIQWFSSLVKSGAHTDAGEINHRIVFTNVVFVTLPVVYLIFMLIDFETLLIPFEDLRFDQFIVPIVIVICWLCFWINRLGFTQVSRSLFLVIWPLLLHILPIQMLHSPIDYLIAYPFGIVFHGLLIQLMFSYRREPWLFWTFIIINLVGALTFPSLLSNFNIDDEIPLYLLTDKYYYLDGILYWLLFNLVIFYILYEMDEYLKRIDASNKLILEQKAELNKSNENLGFQVEQRTARLQEQNEQLKKLAFFNAHLFRGPLCRIKGLILLQEMDEISEEDKNLIKSKLTYSLDELDDRIRELQRIVDSNRDEFEKDL